MNNIDFKSNPFYFNNPYQNLSNSIGEKVQIALFRQNEKDEIVDFANQVTEKAQSLLFKDYEQQIDFAGKAAKTLDWGVFSVVVGMEIPLLIDSIFHSRLHEHAVIGFFPMIAKLATIPLSIFFLSIAVVEGAFEFVTLHRAMLFSRRIQDKQLNPLEKLEWIQGRYFTLETSEEEKIQSYIEKTFPNLNIRDKKRRFDHLAEKVLTLKYESLQRRITPSLAKNVFEQIRTISIDLQSPSVEKREQANQRAEMLVQSLTRQAKNKILVHIFGIAAIFCTIISMSIFLSGVTAGTFFAFMGMFAIFLLFTSLLIDKTQVAKEGEKVYDRINQLIKESSVEFASWLKAAPPFQNFLQIE